MALLLALALLLPGSGVALACDPNGGAGMPASPAEVAGPQVVLPSVIVNVEVARTEAEREKGLGGHAPLGERDGMLFIFDQAAPYSFWMKGMTFPLDMLWIEGGKVVYVAADVPAFPPDTPDSALPIYTPSASAKYVLEVNAGFAAKYGIGVGTTVELRGV